MVKIHYFYDRIFFYRTLFQISVKQCTCIRYTAVVCVYVNVSAFIVCIWHAIALKSAIENINRNDLSVEHSPDIPLIFEMKRKKNTQHISFVCRGVFLGACTFFYNIWMLNTIFFIALWDTICLYYLSICEWDSKKRFDVFFRLSSIFLFSYLWFMRS